MKGCVVFILQSFLSFFFFRFSCALTHRVMMAWATRVTLPTRDKAKWQAGRLAGWLATYPRRRVLESLLLYGNGVVALILWEGRLAAWDGWMSLGDSG